MIKTNMSNIGIKNVHMAKRMKGKGIIIEEESWFIWMEVNRCLEIYRSSKRIRNNRRFLI